MMKKAVHLGLLPLFIFLFLFSFAAVVAETGWAGPGGDDCDGTGAEPGCEGDCTLKSCDGGYMCCGHLFGADCVMDIDCQLCCAIP